MDSNSGLKSLREIFGLKSAEPEDILRTASCKSGHCKLEINHEASDKDLLTKYGIAECKKAANYVELEEFGDLIVNKISHMSVQLLACIHASIPDESLVETVKLIKVKDGDPSDIVRERLSFLRILIF